MLSCGRRGGAGWEARRQIPARALLQSVLVMRGVPVDQAVGALGYLGREAKQGHRHVHGCNQRGWAQRVVALALG